LFYVFVNLLYGSENLFLIELILLNCVYFVKIEFKINETQSVLL
jgi:hypothetical protein